MTVEDAISELLLANAAVVALVSDRVFVPSEQQSETRPYIVHFAVTPDPQYTHAQPGQDGRISLMRWLYQVSCFADSAAGARVLARKVVAALQGTRSAGSPSESLTIFWSPSGFTPLREDNPTMFQIALEFSIFTDLE